MTSRDEGRRSERKAGRSGKHNESARSAALGLRFPYAQNGRPSSGNEETRCDDGHDDSNSTADTNGPNVGERQDGHPAVGGSGSNAMLRREAGISRGPDESSLAGVPRPGPSELRRSAIGGRGDDSARARLARRVLRPGPARARRLRLRACTRRALARSRASGLGAVDEAKRWLKEWRCSTRGGH